MCIYILRISENDKALEHFCYIFRISVSFQHDYLEVIRPYIVPLLKLDFIADTTLTLCSYVSLVLIRFLIKINT